MSEAPKPECISEEEKKLDESINETIEIATEKIWQFCSINNLNNEEFILKLLNLYGKRKGASIAWNICNKYDLIPYLGNIKDKKIIDLGCGTTECHACSWDPDIARALQSAGAEVTGIDRWASPGELYNHIKLDLKDESLLSRLGRESFDIAMANDFFDCLISQDPNQNVQKRIIHEVYGVLKKGGLFIANSIYDVIDKSFCKNLTDAGFAHYRAANYFCVAIKPNK